VGKKPEIPRFSWFLVVDPYVRCRIDACYIDAVWFQMRNCEGTKFDRGTHFIQHF